MTRAFLELTDAGGAGNVPLLEKILMGRECGQFIADLEAVSRTSGKPVDSSSQPPTLALILGNDSVAVLERGLGALPLERRRILLDHPALLHELVELVLKQGGAHWVDQLDLGEEGEQAAERVENRVLAEISPTRRAGNAAISRSWLVGGIACVAASVLIAVFLSQIGTAPPNQAQSTLQLKSEEVRGDQLRTLQDGDNVLSGQQLNFREQVQPNLPIGWFVGVNGQSSRIIAAGRNRFETNEVLQSPPDGNRNFEFRIVLRSKHENEQLAAAIQSWNVERLEQLQETAEPTRNVSVIRAELKALIREFLQRDGVVVPEFIEVRWVLVIEN